jgi:hypothetical protein
VTATPLHVGFHRDVSGDRDPGSTRGLEQTDGLVGGRGSTSMTATRPEDAGERDGAPSSPGARDQPGAANHQAPGSANDRSPRALATSQSGGSLGIV